MKLTLLESWKEYLLQKLNDCSTSITVLVLIYGKIFWSKKLKAKSN